jgi:hypothetical protein
MNSLPLTPIQLDMQSELAEELKAEREIHEAQEQVAQQQRLEFNNIRKQLEVSDCILMNSLSQTPIQLDMQSKLAEELKAEWEVHEAQEQVARNQRLEFDDIRKQLEVSGSYVVNLLSLTLIQLDMQSKLAEELKTNLVTIRDQYEQQMQDKIAEMETSIQQEVNKMKSQVTVCICGYNLYVTH